MSLSYLRKTGQTLDASDRPKDTEIQSGPVKAWVIESNRLANQADSPVESSGWSPVEVWRQRIKRNTGS